MISSEGGDVVGDGASGPAPGSETAAPIESARMYRGDAFVLPLPSGDWTDRSLYVLSGPTCDGLTHSVTIVKETDVPSSVTDGAHRGVEAVLAELEGAQVLRRDDVTLDCGRSAHRVILVWTPDRERRYLEQFYVAAGSSLYVLSAVFTRRSRRRIGAEVERVMRSFEPTS